MESITAAAPPSLEPSSPTPSPGAALVEIRSSDIHGRGVYAREAIAAGTHILEYVGERITKAEAQKRERERLERLRNGGDGSVYIFDLNRRHDIDGRVPWNPARLINHSCAPNCHSEVLGARIWIIATQDIAEGDELTFDYGFALREWRMHPCRCGAPECVGYIVAEPQRARLRRLLQTQRSAAKPVKQSHAG